jgi:hypothetical protein
LISWSAERVLAIWKASELKQLEILILGRSSNSGAEKASTNTRLIKQQGEGEAGSSDTKTETSTVKTETSFQ